jgi:hypothetical protein
VAYRGHVSARPMPSLRACGARPSARASPARMALRRKPGDGAKGGFLGGTHSVRPLSMAKRVPMNSVFTGWPGEAWSPTGTCLDQARCFPLRRAEPAPPRGGRSNLAWPFGERPEMTLRAVFSEGRTLCVRMARPHKCRGIPFLPLDDARGRWPTGHMPRSTPRLPCGRAEPANPPCSLNCLSDRLPTSGKRTSWQQGLFWSILQRGLSWMSPHEGASRGSCGLGRNNIQEKGSSHEHIYREKGRNSLRPTPVITHLWTSAMEEGGG